MEIEIDETTEDSLKQVEPPVSERDTIITRLKEAHLNRDVIADLEEMKLVHLRLFITQMYSHLDL